MQPETPQVRFSAPQICWRNGLCMHSGRGGKAPTKKTNVKLKQKTREGRKEEGRSEGAAPTQPKQTRQSRIGFAKDFHLTQKTREGRK